MRKTTILMLALTIVLASSAMAGSIEGIQYQDLDTNLFWGADTTRTINDMDVIVDADTLSGMSKGEIQAQLDAKPDNSGTSNIRDWINNDIVPTLKSWVKLAMQEALIDYEAYKYGDCAAARLTAHYQGSTRATYGTCLVSE